MLAKEIWKQNVDYMRAIWAGQGGPRTKKSCRKKELDILVKAEYEMTHGRNYMSAILRFPFMW